MTDIPPEVAVARDIVIALTAAGRCREDAPLYAVATGLLRLYLESAGPGSPGPVATPVVSSNPPGYHGDGFTIGSPVASTQATAAPLHPVPTTPQPRSDAVWNPWVGTWMVRTG